MEVKLKEIMSAVLETEINKNSTRETVETWDSIKHIELILTIEEEFEISISPEVIPKLSSFEEIYRIISKGE